MKCVVNTSYGGFCVPREVQELLSVSMWGMPLDNKDNYYDIRFDPKFIEWVENHEGETSLAVAEIPEDATDWEISEYDGVEHIIAVVDGFIRHIWSRR